MSAAWQHEEIFLLEAIRPVLNTNEVWMVFDELEYHRSIEAILKKARQIDSKFKDFGIPNTKGLTTRQKEVIENVLKSERQPETSSPTIAISSSKKATHTNKSREAAYLMIEDLQDIREEVPRISSLSMKRATGNKESLVIILSDNHIGRKFHDVDSGRIYNMNIALNRLKATPELVRNALTDDHLKEIDECVVLMIGDHIDGEGIFPAQEMHLETHAVDQVKQAASAFWYVVKQLRAMFPMVRIVTTKGNHGRAGTSPESNWDNVLFLMLSILVDQENDPNLTIKNQSGDYNTVNIKGWKGHLRHKAYVQADTSSGIAKFAGWYGIHQWDFFAYAHYHHWGVMTWCGKPIFRNGSVMGGDDYAESLSYIDNPVQLCFGITEENLPTFIHPLKYT